MIEKGDYYIKDIDGKAIVRVTDKKHDLKYGTTRIEYTYVYLENKRLRFEGFQSWSYYDKFNHQHKKLSDNELFDIIGEIL